MTEATTARPYPLASLLASAQRVTSKSLQRGWGKSKAWQDDAWDMFDLVGEHRFLATTLAGRMSQAKLFVGKISDDPTEEPVRVEDQRYADILESIGSSASARSQLIARLGINLFVAGDGWLVGIPRYLIPPSLLVGTLSEPTVDQALIEIPEPGTVSIDDLDWRMLSISEVSANAGGEVTLRLGETDQEQIMVSPDLLVLIRVWRPHPRHWWEADSPTRSSLPVLRELVGLNMHASAEIDSRLAGAGLLIIPQSAQRALQIAAGITELDNAPDQFTEALMEAMIRPIQDRASASAVVPLVVTVPDEACALFNFMSFDKPLDITSGEKMDRAVRRLALGLDAPPELLLGTGGMNHWGAWLVLEDVVSTHLEPPLALICDAITTQYLWPVLVEQGMSADEARNYVIWYDVSDLVVRPTRGADALALHAVGAISDETLRDAHGFDESNAPAVDAGLPVEVQLAFDLVRANTALFTDPGLPQIIAQIRAAMDGDIPEMVDPTQAKQEAAEAAAEAAKQAVDSPAPPGQGVQPIKAVPDLEPIAASALNGYLPGVASFRHTCGEEFGGPGSGRYPCGSGERPNQRGCMGKVGKGGLPDAPDGEGGEPAAAPTSLEGLEGAERVAAINAMIAEFEAEQKATAGALAEGKKQTVVGRPMDQAEFDNIARQQRLPGFYEEALEDYTGSGFYHVNESLRRDDIDGEAEAMIEALDGAFNEKARTRDRPTLVYRGGAPTMDDLAIGATVVDQAFMSTTTDEDITGLFGGGMITINLPTDFPFLIGKHNENELLLPRGTVLKKVGNREFEAVMPKGSR